MPEGDIPMTYTVKEFANMFHATEHTVRYYTEDRKSVV